jgi:hypothetical protein
VEYEADGRDFRETKEFLTFHPDIFEKQETFRTAAMKYMQDEFYNQPDAEIPLNNQMFFFLKYYSKYANHTTKKKVIDRRNYCKDCHREIPRTLGDKCPECARKVNSLSIPRD